MFNIFSNSPFVNLNHKMVTGDTILPVHHITLCKVISVLESDNHLGLVKCFRTKIIIINL